MQESARSRKKMLAEMRSSRACGVLVALLLSGCSSVEMPAVTYTTPSAPTQTAVVEGIRKAASEAKIGPAVEISEVRPADHGPGRYFVCMRELVSSTSEKRPAYSVFYDNNDFKGERLSVIMDACEAQAFTAIDIAPSPVPSPSPSPKPGRTNRK